MTTPTRRREFDCPADGHVVTDEACCPVCTRPLEPADGATQARYGYSAEDMQHALCSCAWCPTDDQDRTVAYEVTWRDTPHAEPEGVEIHRLENGERVGTFGPDGALLTDLEQAEREAFRLHFPELCGD